MNRKLAVAAQLMVFGMGCGLPDGVSDDQLGSVESALSTFGPWSAGMNLGNVINTATVEAGVFVTKDQRALYFVSNRPGGMGGIDIYVSVRESTDDAFGAPAAVPALNSPGDDFCPALSSDGLTIIFSSTKAGGCGAQDLYVSHRTDASDHQGWSAPVNFGCTFNTAANDGSPSLRDLDDDEGGAGNRQMYFWSARAGGMGGNDIWVATLAADDSVVVAPALVPELNSTANDLRPDVRRDGKEIFFESNRPGGLGGTDLWVSNREHGEWTAPTRVESVNSAAAEGSASLSWDGQSLYYFSTQAGGFGSNDLYVATRAKKNGK